MLRAKFENVAIFDIDIAIIRKIASEGVVIL